MTGKYPSHPVQVVVLEVALQHALGWLMGIRPGLSFLQSTMKIAMAMLVANKWLTLKVPIISITHKSIPHTLILTHVLIINLFSSDTVFAAVIQTSE